MKDRPTQWDRVRSANDKLGDLNKFPITLALKYLICGMKGYAFQVNNFSFASGRADKIYTTSKSDRQ